MKHGKEILSNYSKDVFDYYLRPFNNGMALMPGKNISNPFISTKQKTPSFNIYFNARKSTWYYKDFATNDGGNCFELVKRLFQITYQDALQQIQHEVFNTPDMNTYQSTPLNSPPTFKGIDIKSRPFTTLELDYWKQYGIDAEALSKYDVSAVNYENNNEPANQGHAFNPMFAYYYGDGLKIYQPFSTKNRFFFKGNKPSDFYFGYAQLPASGEYLFLTGGEKDVISLSVKGFSAICLNSETANFPKELASELSDRFQNIIVLYDNDTTGIKHAAALTNTFQWPNIQLPAQDGIKDISDFFKKGHTSDDLRQMIDKGLKDNASLSGHAGSWSNLETTPRLPDLVYDQLPSFFQEIAMVHTHPRFKDIILLGAIILCSGCLPGLHGIYMGNISFSNLYLYVISPAAGGKGSLSPIRKLGTPIHLSLKARSAEAYKLYKEKLAIYKKSKEQENLTEPEKPKSRILFVPGDNSKAGLIDQLQENGGSATIMETEADTMAAAMAQEWGKTGDIYRKGFHHEPLGCIRKTDKIHTEVNQPRISIILASTVRQLGGIIKSAEDGLFSRFIYYVFEATPEWHDVSPAGNQINLDQHFLQLGERLLEIYNYYDSTPTAFELTTPQWKLLNEFGTKRLKEVTVLYADDATSIVKRMALIMYRIAMVLTAIRCHEEMNLESNLVCNDQDFNTAFFIANNMLQHSTTVFNNLPTPNNNLEGSKKRLYDLLPNHEFKSQEAAQIGLKLQLADRTVRNYIKGFCEAQLIEQIKPGLYKKMVLPNMPSAPSGV